MPLASKFRSTWAYRRHLGDVLCPVTRKTEACLPGKVQMWREILKR